MNVGEPGESGRTGTHAFDELGDKIRANRKFRRVARERIRADSEAPPDIREVSNVWLFAKDGRHFVRNPEIAARVIRK